jgi:hypothetical protein
MNEEKYLRICRQFDLPDLPTARDVLKISHEKVIALQRFVRAVTGHSLDISDCDLNLLACICCLYGDCDILMFFTFLTVNPSTRNLDEIQIPEIVNLWLEYKRLSGDKFEVHK